MSGDAGEGRHCVQGLVFPSRRCEESRTEQGILYCILLHHSLTSARVALASRSMYPPCTFARPRGTTRAMEQVLLVSLLGDAGLLPELPGRWPGDPSELSAAGAAKHMAP